MVVLKPAVGRTSEARSRRAAAPQETGKYRLLLAEDNPINQLVALGQLEVLGYQADAAGNGHEVLQSLEKSHYDLILMDCQMPELDGYETSRRIREFESLAGRSPVPIVAVTAHAMKGDREKCLAAGMNDYLSKPFRQDDLAAILSRWLAGGPADLPARRRRFGAEAVSRPEIWAAPGAGSPDFGGIARALGTFDLNSGKSPHDREISSWSARTSVKQPRRGRWAVPTSASVRNRGTFHRENRARSQRFLRFRGRSTRCVSELSQKATAAVASVSGPRPMATLEIGFAPAARPISRGKSALQPLQGRRSP